MFSIKNNDKIPLIETIIRADIKDLIFGSGPNDLEDMSVIIDILQKKELLTTEKLSVILLLNCYAPLIPQFKAIPKSLRKYITISFGMVDNKSEAYLFEKAVNKFREIGYESFRVSLLNNFSLIFSKRKILP